MMVVELTDPHHVTAGYTGVPGDRVFYFQAQDEHELLTLQMEKAQFAGLGELLGQLLHRVDDGPATDWDRDAMDLRRPIESAWRVGEMSLGLDPEVERFVLDLAEMPLEDVTEPREARVWFDRDQARRLAAHAGEVIGQGRPRCELCGRPTDLDGTHVCPSTNGHGRLTR